MKVTIEVKAAPENFAPKKKREHGMHFSFQRHAGLLLGPL
jgi:hypothetical protein